MHKMSSYYLDCSNVRCKKCPRGAEGSRGAVGPRGDSGDVTTAYDRPVYIYNASGLTAENGVYAPFDVSSETIPIIRNFIEVTKGTATQQSHVLPAALDETKNAIVYNGTNPMNVIATVNATITGPFDTINTLSTVTIYKNSLVTPVVSSNLLIDPPSNVATSMASGPLTLNPGDELVIEWRVQSVLPVPTQGAPALLKLATLNLTMEGMSNAG